MFSIKLEEFTHTKSLDKLAELHEVLNEQRLSAKDTGVNYRVINHWDEKGIIRFTRATKDSNRKFSFIDFIWIKIVNELRSFGVKLPVIQKIASDIYQPLPMRTVFDNLANNIDVLKTYEGSDKEGFLNFLKSGEYKNADVDSLNVGFTYLHILIAEAVTTRNSLSLIVFNDGEWFPYLKDSDYLYTDKLLYRKEFSSQVRVNITELIFHFILDDYLIEYCNGLHLFTPQEIKLLYYVKEGDYKRIMVLFKSKKNEPIEIAKSKTSQEAIMQILREKEYREFIVTDKKGREFRIREEEPKVEEEEDKKNIVRKTYKERREILRAAQAKE